MTSDDTIATLRAKFQRWRIDGQVQFAREAFRNDGAEGETVWALAAAAEQLPALLDRLERAEARVAELQASVDAECDRIVQDNQWPRSVHLGVAMDRIRRAAGVEIE
jgi:hypothetical protein